MIRKKKFKGTISIMFQFGVNIIGLPNDPIVIGRFAKYKYINVTR